MNLTNRYDLPNPIVTALSTVHEDYGGKATDPNTISVTTLISPPIIRRLWQEHEPEIEQDVSEMIWLLLGKASHKVVEYSAGDGDAIEELRAIERFRDVLTKMLEEICAGVVNGMEIVKAMHERFQTRIGLLLQKLNGAIVEKRLHCRTKDGWHLHGQLDYLDSEGILWDYKVTSVWSVMQGVKPEWEAQLNVLDLLARLNGINVKGIRLCLILRDWNKHGTKKNPNYPDCQIKTVYVRRWPHEKQVQYVAERLRLHGAANDAATVEDVPVCSMAERWQDPPTIAVYRGASLKKAAKLFKEGEVPGVSAQDAAADWIVSVQKPGESFTMKERPSEPKRCMDYCAVARWCPFGREVLAAQVEESVPDDMA